MARYSALVGKRVEVRYRAGGIHLPAHALLVADSGKSIFLEEHISQEGALKSFRWEIPYRSIVSVQPCAAALAAVAADPALPGVLVLEPTHSEP